MKRLCTFLSLLAFTLGTLSAQQTVTVKVANGNPAGSPLRGVAVFFYDSPQAWNSNGPLLSKAFSTWDYTDNQGEASFFIGNLNPNDTFFFATQECNGPVVWGAATPASVGLGQNPVLSLPCAPAVCEAMVRVDTLFGQFLFVEAISFRDSAYANFPATPVNHAFLVDNQFHQSRLSLFGADPNYDTLMLPLGQYRGRIVSVCYSRIDSFCLFTCDSVNLNPPAGGGGGGGSNPNPISCSANYWVDSVNSLTFQNQIVLWENSSVSNGNIVNWFWDFGDGTTINARYPIHTYNAPTGTYPICLTITAVDSAGIDTCVSTYCDTIGIDSLGNLVYKGMSNLVVNVIDPATVGNESWSLSDQLELYPNPATDRTQLRWDAGLKVDRVDLFDLRGQRLNSWVEPTEPIAVGALAQGVYLIRVSSGEAQGTLRLLVP